MRIDRVRLSLAGTLFLLGISLAGCAAGGGQGTQSPEDTIADPGETAEAWLDVVPEEVAEAPADVAADGSGEDSPQPAADVVPDVDCPAECADDLECTVDSCLEGSCVHDVAAGFCLIDEACVAAEAARPDHGCQRCVPDENTTAWTLDAGAACDDADACTVADTCTPAGCVGAPLVCDDGLACTTGHCLDGECSFEVKDGFCLLDGVCVAAGDAPSPEADPHWQCRVCAPAESAGAWSPLEGACGDVESCADPRHCVAGECVPTGSDPCAGAPAPVCHVPVCDEESGACAAVPTTDGTPCDDGNGCTTNDACLVGTCAGELACDCLDDADCQAHEDDNVCNGALVCNAENACVVDPATLVDCPESLDPCLVNLCDPESGACLPVPQPAGTPCDDLDPCTQDDACANGTCLGVPVSCDDGSPCTQDQCVDGACKHFVQPGPCDYGSPCTHDDKCVLGVCQPGPLVQCDDGNPCTLGTCQPDVGCVFTPKAGSCDDGNVCTQVDSCFDGDCIGSDPVACDDGNNCTVDSCDPGAGCKHWLDPECNDLTPAPEFTLPDLNPNSPTHEQALNPAQDFLGLVVVFYFADVNCPGCQQTAGALDDIYREYLEQGVADLRFVTINGEQYDTGSGPFQYYIHKHAPPLACVMMQDSLEVGAWKAFNGMKDDLFVVGRFGYITHQWQYSQGTLINPILEEDAATLRAAIDMNL